MTTVAPSDSGSSFSSAPSDSGSHTYSHHSLLALAAMNNNPAAFSAAGGGGGSVTPSKSLTPRYAALHGPTSGVAQTYLQHQRMQHQRREARPRFVEGGAPAERYLEPLPQHLQLPSQPQVYQQQPQTFGSGSHLRSLSPQTQRGGGGGGFSSPSFRQLPPCPASPMSVINTTSQSSPSTQSIHPPLVSSSYQQPQQQLHSSSTSANSPQAAAMMMQLSGNSESCISLRAAASGSGGGGHGSSTTIIVHNAPYSGALTLDSVASRGLVPSPLASNLNPASPCLPRPPSMSDRAPNPRQRSVGGGSSSASHSISPQRPPVAAVRIGGPPADVDSLSGSNVIADVEEPSLSHVLGNYYAGIQKVDSMVLNRIGSGALLPSSMLSPPSHPMGGFARSGHQLSHLPHQLEISGGEDDRSASTSTGHASPYSSFRLDGTQWEVPSPRVASTNFMDVSGLRTSPQAHGMTVSVGDAASPTNMLRTPTFGSPRTLVGFPTGSYAGSPLAKHHLLAQNIMFVSHQHHMQQGAASPSAFTSPPEERLFDGRICFSFQPRDGACTVDSLEEQDEDVSAQQSPR
jgi:hypothetical protein